MSKKIKIDFDIDIPIFQQIVNEIEIQILSGELKEGEYLTSVREFAVSQTINPNTVAKAYQQLQVIGLVESARGKGLCVKKLKDKTASLRRNEIIEEKIRGLLDLGKSLNLDTENIISLIKNIGSKK